MFTSIPLHAWTDSLRAVDFRSQPIFVKQISCFPLAVIPPVVEPAIGPRHSLFSFIHRIQRRYRRTLHQCSRDLGCPRILRHSRCYLRAVLPESHLRQAHRHSRSSLRPSRRPESRKLLWSSVRTGSRTRPGRTCPTDSQ
jgi:hypothetical protein